MWWQRAPWAAPGKALGTSTPRPRRLAPSIRARRGTGGPIGALFVVGREGSAGGGGAQSQGTSAAALLAKFASFQGPSMLTGGIYSKIVLVKIHSLGHGEGVFDALGVVV